MQSSLKTVIFIMALMYLPETNRLTGMQLKPPGLILHLSRSADEAGVQQEPYTMIPVHWRT